jgi:hypothetical protein
LFHNYLTLLVVATYVIAPLPNWLCGRAATNDDFMESHGNGVVDFGRFLTGFFVVMGIGTSQQHEHAHKRPRHLALEILDSRKHQDSYLRHAL